MSVTMLTCDLEVTCRDCGKKEKYQINLDDLDLGYVLHCPRCYQMSVLYLADNPDRWIKHYKVDKED